MTGIKVAHVGSLDTFIAVYMLNQLVSLKEAGYRVSALAAPGPHVRRIEEAGIEFIPITMTRNFTPLADLGSLYALYEIMRRERFTIVHTHNPKPGLLGQLAARMAGVPLVLNTFHGLYFHEHMPALKRRFYIAMEKMAARCSDFILSQNREDIATAVHEGICAPDKIAELGNGIDLTCFDPAQVRPEDLERERARWGIPAGALVVGFVGRLAARRKGFLDFLRAGEEVARHIPNVRFLIIGEADHGKPDAVEPAVANDYGIGPLCHFIGTRPNDELPRLYALMDLLVLPSLFEGLPRVIIEASAMGVPSVASNVKGNREAVVHGATGLLVPLGDIRALACASRDILADGARARAMGAAARAMALERFDERHVFARIKAHYARLLRRPHEATPLPAAPQPVQAYACAR